MYMREHEIDSCTRWRRKKKRSNGLLASRKKTKAPRARAVALGGQRRAPATREPGDLSYEREGGDWRKQSAKMVDPGEEKKQTKN